MQPSKSVKAEPLVVPKSKQRVQQTSKALHVLYFFQLKLIKMNFTTQIEVQRYCTLIFTVIYCLDGNTLIMCNVLMGYTTLRFDFEGATEDSAFVLCVFHLSGVIINERWVVLDMSSKLTFERYHAGKFSCCPVTNPDDPIEDPFSLPCTTKVENSSSLPLQRKPKIYAPPVKPPSSFVSLNKYGYEVKYPGSLLKLNISGTVFIVKISTLQKDQIVFEKILETAEYIPETDEYYLERDPVVFRFVHNYLRHQEMHLPLNICGPLLEKELEAWGLQLGFDLQRCCLGPVMDTKSKMESLRKFEETFSESLSDKEFNAQYTCREQLLDVMIKNGEDLSYSIEISQKRDYFYK
ncbi:Potassium voltage-gated channel subfamily C member 3 [Echinococcus granulosus]|uniref:Potassium voltage-gated channel subfamily C member 3 n=1 Tax=Echinococcus granulosus TaxID=6210 RepID=W6UDZ5_ECHGR|nr:Potassium voltage-gated channel subfamily C member 3 [Echinococcus granulosus]EUB59263.1 Potassium voltage-gated channel subfamily C member 3 [Echinococcus granulosus]